MTQEYVYDYEPDYDQLMADIETLIQEGNLEGVRNLYETVHSVDIDEVLEDLDDSSLRYFLFMLEFEDISDLLENAEEDLQIRMMELYSTKELIEIFTFMANADVADLLGLLSTRRRKELLNYMKKSDSNILKMILSFDEESAGGVMTTEFISLKQSLSVREALLKIKDIAPETEIIESIFITDRQHRLQGIVDLREILVAPGYTPLSDLIEDMPFFIYAEDDQEEAANIIFKYDLKYLPVVNQKMAILGVITSDDIIEVMEQEHSEDILAMSGVSKDEEYDSTFASSVRSRLPWLLVNLVTAFMASAVVSLFEGTISQVVALAAAMPIVTGMGGNAGNQALSIVLTSIARGDMDLEDDWKLIVKEIVLGLFNGAVVGLFAGIILYMKYGNIILGLIIFASMIINMIIAGIVGFLLPLLFDHIDVDPAISSPIFLTTTTDIFGFFVFLGLASIVLPYLV
ncbi:magnesium transporter [Peptoniphilus sp. KCTC 25270]|uniref:magnesium transporter n=1 Tax=Peptoniphilus sp. KCTC 25270 TaxID=2897414 RepID=UPI001E507672|nr:magnesium transporter [Peptoniphilus sp. KCTC 25270]MCD1147212.1 magnesium transporter [Peptoniphilus sp. KCTC 25270]